MKFNLYNEVVEFTDIDLVHAGIAQWFEQQAKKNSEEYCKFYNSCNNVDDVLQKSKGKILSLYKICAQQVSDLLAANKIFGITVETIIDSDEIKLDYKYILWNLSDKREAIEKDLNAEKTQRAIRKATRGRFVGGGFGFSGAIKGMAMAGTMNAATGVMHSIANAFGNMFSQSSYNQRKRNLYSSDLCKKIASAVESDSLKYLYVLEALLKTKNLRLKYGYNNKMESIRRYNQICKNEIDKKYMGAAFVEMLKLYPIDEEYYHMICGKIGDSNGELEKCMEFFNFDTEYVQQVNASYEYKMALFGPYGENIKKKSTEYLCAIFQDFEEEGVLSYFEEDILNVPYQWLKDCRYWANQSNKDSMFLFTHGHNQILYNSGVLQRMQKGEIALCGFRLNKYGLSTTYSPSNFLIITSRAVYSHKHSVPIMQIKNVQVDEEEIYINGTTFCKNEAHKTYDQLLEGTIWAIIVGIQCYLTFGKTNKKLPLLNDCSAEEKDIIENPDAVFEYNYYSLLSKYNDSEHVVAQLYYSNDEVYTYKNMNTIALPLPKAVHMHGPLRDNEKVLAVLAQTKKESVMLTNQFIYIHTNNCINKISIDDVRTIVCNGKDGFLEEKDKCIINDNIKFSIYEGRWLCEYFFQIRKIIHTENEMLSNKDIYTDEYRIEIAASKSIQESMKEMKQKTLTYESGSPIYPYESYLYQDAIKNFNIEKTDSIYYIHSLSSLQTCKQGILIASSGVYFNFGMMDGKQYFTWEEFVTLQIGRNLYGITINGMELSGDKVKMIANILIPLQNSIILQMQENARLHEIEEQKRQELKETPEDAPHQSQTIKHDQNTGEKQEQENEAEIKHLEEQRQKEIEERERIRKAEEQKRLAEEAERKRIEEQRQKEIEEQERIRKAEEQKRLAEEAERKRIEKQRQKGIEEQKRLEKEAERKRIEEQRKAEEAIRAKEHEKKEKIIAPLNKTLWSELAQKNYTKVDGAYFSYTDRNGDTIVIVLRSIANVLNLIAYKKNVKNNVLYSVQTIAVKINEQGNFIAFNDRPIILLDSSSYIKVQHRDETCLEINSIPITVDPVYSDILARTAKKSFMPSKIFK